jgi:hypothetical protein
MNLSDVNLINLYAAAEGLGADALTLKRTVYAVGTVSELTRLAEIRLEELERRLAELETIFLENSLTDVIDGRGISAFIGGVRVDEA